MQPVLRTPVFLVAAGQRDSVSVLEREVLYADPRSDARCVPWCHDRNASGGASSLLDRGGRGTMGLSGRGACRQGCGSSRPPLWVGQIATGSNPAEKLLP